MSRVSVLAHAGSGSLDAAEVTGLAQRFYDGRPPTQKKINEIISRLDADGDGKVTLEELLQSAAALQNVRLTASKHVLSLGCVAHTKAVLEKIRRGGRADRGAPGVAYSRRCGEPDRL